MKSVEGSWRIAGGHEVYVEDGKVLRAVKADENGHPVPAYPYQSVSAKYGGGYRNAVGVKLSTLRAGLRSGRYIIT